MRIRRLDICGFKSFMDRMTFVFDTGITGVVGPNGCGKSNVVDAIRWVMGEQSAKHLRGHAMSDVIFNGSEHHAPLGMSEVSLTFENDGSMPLPPQYAGFPEITLTRRLFRNGDSEYLINKTVCRLLDITELLLGTGVGTKAYSIIEQGRIGLIVSSKPEDRRSMIEEAAGVTKYKARRRAAERKMEYTEQNLVRVGDIIGELEKRCEQLQRQAKKAEKYKALKAEMKEIELHVASLKHLELSSLAEASRQRVEQLAAEEAQLGTELATGEEQLAYRRAELIAEETALVQRTEQLFGLENQIKVDEATLEFCTREENEARARMTQAQTEQAQLVQQAEALEAERVAAEAELIQLAEVVAKNEALLAEREQESQKLVGEQSAAAQTLDAEREILVQVITRVAEVKNNLANLGKQRVDLAARLGKLDSETGEINARLGNLDREKRELSDALGTTRQMKLSLEERRGLEETALAQTRTAFVENEARLIALREELGDKRSRLNSLTEIARNYEGYDRGVRAVMLKAGEDREQNGVYGLVADLLSAAQPEHEKALEAALGQRLQTVVVKGHDEGRAAISFLKSGGEGRSSFIPLDVQPRHADPQGQMFEGFVARAIDVVRHEPRHANVVKALLGDVVIVQDIPAAIAGAARNPGFSFVTLTGEVLDGQGVLTGGTLEGPGAGALQKKREIQELADQVMKVEGLFAQAQHEHGLLARKAAELEGGLKALTADTHEKELNLVNQEKDLARAAEELARLRERLNQVALEREVLERAEAELASEEAQSQGQSVAGETEKQGREAKVAELSAALDALRSRADALGRELTELRVKSAQDVERREGVLRTQARVAQSKLEVDERAQRVATAIADDDAKIQAVSAQKAAAQAERDTLQTQADALKAELTEKRAAHAEKQAQLTGREGELRAMRKRLEETAAGKAEHSLKERELALQLNHLTEQIRERYALELVMELHRFHALPQPGPEKEQRLVELRAQVERMGEINLTAIDEFKELSERFEFLSKQKADLEASLQQLRAAIVKIDQTSQERFAETYELVNDKFQQIFPRLFAGGKASLQMVTDPQTGEQGIEILAQPPGKSLKTVNLLSGGEKALTAVALIFAIFLIKPTPFCLLDEVDAPLDDANVGRYNEMIREMSSQSQFILITHNKRTMEIADTLYGVTMEEPGVSKLVSVKLSEASQRASVA
ncbi:MAG: chromosome segregation protein SMC [Deltaproteobacteria bacterium]|nr:chromosome segregation protein SMC [Deltaproteobacteria bacterium]